jgi:hypothetical protein
LTGQRQLARANAESVMCDKCEQLDKKIEHFRQLAMRIMDPQLSEGIDKLIKEMQAQKAALHPDEKA